jgi:hypothetical protein
MVLTQKSFPDGSAVGVVPYAAAEIIEQKLCVS